MAKYRSFEVFAYREVSGALEEKNITPYVSSARVDYGDVSSLSNTPSASDGVIRTASFELKQSSIESFNYNKSKSVLTLAKTTLIAGTDTFTIQTGILNDTINTTTGSLEIESYNEETGELILSEVLTTDTDIMYSYFSTTNNNIYDSLSNFNPFIYNERKVIIRTIEADLELRQIDVEGNGGNRYAIPSYENIDEILKGSVTCKAIGEGIPVSQFTNTVASYTNTVASYINSTTFEVGVVFIDNETGEFVFDKNIDAGVIVRITFSEITNKQTIENFQGFMTIPTFNNAFEMSVECKSVAYLFQKTYIQNETIREYSITESAGVVIVTDVANVINYVGGIPVATLFQNMLDDTGFSITLNDLTTTNNVILTKLDTATLWSYNSLWEFFQGICSSFALFFGYVNNDDGELELQLIDIPVSKTGGTDVDHYVSAEIDLKEQSLSTNSENIINSIRVFYYDIDDNYTRKSVIVTNAASVSDYGERSCIIEEENTSVINTETKATQFAQSILDETANLIVESQLTLLGNSDIKLFDVIEAKNRVLSDEDKLLSVESISLDISKENIITTVKAVGRVDNKVQIRQGKTKFRDMLIKPGYKKQVTAANITNLYQFPKPLRFVLKDSGLEAIDLTPTVYAVLRWEKPFGYNPVEYRLEVALSTDTDFENAKRYSLKDQEDIEFFDQRVELVPNEAYIARVAAVSKEGIIGVYSSTLTISAVGDSVSPFIPTGLSVKGQDEGISVSFDPVTDVDLLGYVIYAKEGGSPSQDTGFRAGDGTYDFRKETASILTFVSELEAGVWFFRVSAFDSSGNESVFCSTEYTSNTPIKIIRTQEDCINWLKTLPFDGTLLDADYDTVKFYKKADGTNYIVNELVGGLGKEFSIRNLNLTAEKGVVIEVNVGYIPSFNVKSNQFKMDNLNWITDNGARMDFKVERYYPADDFYSYTISNCNLKNSNLWIAGVDNAEVLIEKNIIDRITSSTCDNVKVFGNTFTDLYLGGSKKIYIDKNTINGVINANTYDGNTLTYDDIDGGYITNNVFNSTDCTKTYVDFIIAGGKQVKDINISGNEINIDDPTGSPSAYFIRGNQVKYSNIEGNIAKSNYTTLATTLIGWIASYDKGVGTYENTNTNKNKIGL